VLSISAGSTSIQLNVEIGINDGDDGGQFGVVVSSSSSSTGSGTSSGDISSTGGKNNNLPPNGGGEGNYQNPSSSSTGGSGYIDYSSSSTGRARNATRTAAELMADLQNQVLSAQLQHSSGWLPAWLHYQLTIMWQ
jgi:hypothetical protein